MSGDLVTVWTIGDGVRVNPETGGPIEERPDIHADYPSGEYREKNVVWDASESRVVLHSARNEFVSFQIIVASAQPVAGVEVRLDRLLGPGGAEISGRNVALFKAWYVRVRQPSTGYEKTSLGPGWYPDALLPAPTGEPLCLDLPDEKNAIGESHRHQTVWCDIYLPQERAAAPPGLYRGTLSVSWPGGQRELQVELRVWDFALPDEIHCRGNIYNNSIQHMEPDLELRYFQMARRHGFQPGIVYYRPELKVDGTKVHIDWSAYDDRLMKYLDGSAFTETSGYWGPGVGLPIDHIILPFDCGKKPARRGAWPIAMPDGGPTEDFEAVWVETERQLREHFEADPHRRRVEKIVFLEGLDEAYSEDAYQQMIYYANLLRRGLGKEWFKHRIDGGYSREAMEKLHPYVDLVICHTIAFDADKIAHFREKGVESWCYGPMIYERRENSACGSNTFLDLDLLTCRGLAWATWKHRCGYCQWEFEWAGDRAWTEALNWVTEHVEYNGSGLLIYRGDVVGSPDPIPSIRLKAHRRGFQDYEYFWLLQQAGREADADEAVDSIIHTTPFGEASIENTEIWRNDPEVWDRARLQLGEKLHAILGAQETR
jgi:hypothetical protein